MNRLISTLGGLLLLASGVDAALGGDGLASSALRCEYRVDPAGIDEAHPRLTWLVESDQRGQRQSAYRVLVASSTELLAGDRADMWDSGKIESPQTVNVSYAGEPLRSRTPYYWKVRVWDREGRPSDWSPVARWSMGVLDPAEWTAQYISFNDESPIHKEAENLYLPPARQYRKEFEVGKRVRRATVYATALGIYELHLNGERIGDAYFAPGWTDYHQRAYYQTYDVTDRVRDGKNAVGAWVADGWYSGYVGFGLLTGIGTEKIGRYSYGKTPSVIAQLEIEYEDGSKDVVGTDPSWRVTGEGPVREADFLMGEFYDATKETPGWSLPGFDDSGWDAAVLASDNDPPNANFYEYANPEQPGGGPKIVSSVKSLGFRRPQLEAFPGVPVRVTQEVESIQVVEQQPGVYIFDLGQNFAGIYRLKAKGPKGQRVRLRFGEMLYPDGRLMTENLRKARSHDHYVLKGDPAGETYVPRFTCHGFRYVEVTGYPGKPTKDAVTGLVLHSDTPRTSSFECSDPTTNRLFQNVVWTQRANFIDLPTDCPQRDERMGWTGDAQVYIGSAAINADVSAFFTKWLRELMESQRPSGVFPGYAPYPFQHGLDFGTAWCDAGVICPWTIWQAYGDTQIIERCWGPMTAFMDWRKGASKDYLGIEHGNAWGDWLSQGETTPLAYIDTVYYAVSTRKMAEMAEAIGRRSEAERYRDLWAKIQNAFAKKYVLPNGRLGVDTQTAYALAFFAGLVPEAERDALGDRLAEKIAANGNRMSTGFLGTYALLPALTDAGHHDLATFLLQSHEFPSWGYEVEQGATTIWERWDSYTKKDAFGRHNAAMNSFSHYAFGAVCEWMFDTLAGIRAGKPGYEHVVIDPTPPSPGSNADREPIHWVKASHHSIRGTIVSEWKVEGDQFQLEVTIPANTTATVTLPTAEAEAISEGGMPLKEVQGVRLVRSDGGRTELEVESGVYRFTCRSSLESAADGMTASKGEAP